MEVAYINCRYEKLEVRQVSSHAKCIGTLLSITGALMVTLYRAEPNSGRGNSKVEEDDKAIRAMGGSYVSQDEWILGGILLSIGSFCVSLAFNIKTWIMKEYPEVVMTATLSTSFVVILSAIVALVAERNNTQAWILRPDMELAAILFSGLIVVTMRSITLIWACGKKGPVYVAMFTPVGMVVALVMGLSFLGESLALGSVIGGVVISIGFYGFLWGQAQQEKMALERKVICSLVSSSSSSSSSNNAAPFLQNQEVGRGKGKMTTFSVKKHVWRTALLGRRLFASANVPSNVGTFIPSENGGKAKIFLGESKIL